MSVWIGGGERERVNEFDWKALSIALSSDVDYLVVLPFQQLALWNESNRQNRMLSLLLSTFMELSSLKHSGHTVTYTREKGCGSGTVNVV